jgi:zinc transporter, ZIP family
VQAGVPADWDDGEVVSKPRAGIANSVVYISLDELLSTSRAYGKGHDSLLGLLAGMAVVAVSLLIMG